MEAEEVDPFVVNTDQKELLLPRFKLKQNGSRLRRRANFYSTECFCGKSKMRKREIEKYRQCIKQLSDPQNNVYKIKKKLKKTKEFQDLERNYLTFWKSAY